MLSFLVEHSLISSNQLRFVLPVARVSDARPSYLGFLPLESGATFLFVPIVRLTEEARRGFLDKRKSRCWLVF